LAVCGAINIDPKCWGPESQLGKGRKRNKNIFQAVCHALAQGGKEKKKYSQVLSSSNEGLLLESVMQP